MPQPSLKGFSQRSQWLIAIISLTAIIVALILISSPTKNILECLLVDLELAPLNGKRQQFLSKVIGEVIPSTVPELAGITINVTHAHFSEIDYQAIIKQRPDFIVLSPQSTLWQVYWDDQKDELKRALIGARKMAEAGVPIIGICGGQQFLAMAFGAKVDFIDPLYQGKTLLSYYGYLKCEKGWKRLDIKKTDPIFKGIQQQSPSFWAYEAHCEEVKEIPNKMVNLAEGELSKIQLLKLSNQMVYGVSFHPEAGWRAAAKGPGLEPNAREILSNFIIAVKNK